MAVCSCAALTLSDVLIRKTSAHAAASGPWTMLALHLLSALLHESSGTRC